MTETKIFEELDQNNQKNYFWSWFSLCISFITLYAVLFFLIWKLIPKFRQFQNKVNQIRQEIKLPSDEGINDKFKNKAQTTIKKTRKEIENLIKQKTEETLNSAANTIKDKTEEEIKNAL